MEGPQEWPEGARQLLTPSAGTWGLRGKELVPDRAHAPPPVMGKLVGHRELQREGRCPPRVTKGCSTPPPLPTGKGKEQGSLFHYVKIEKRRDEGVERHHCPTRSSGAPPAPAPSVLQAGGRRGGHLAARYPTDNTGLRGAGADIPVAIGL